jgi:hypothetical protein
MATSYDDVETGRIAQTRLCDVARALWIAEIRISEAVEDKLSTKHNLSGAIIRAVCVPRQYDAAAWEDHPEHGERLVVQAHDEFGMIRVVLQPVDVTEGIWRLRTAWRRM